ncbi:hypothetical protein B0H19DRAFT_1309446 [Mycena capillaripes]|nr:hypothetical protein B0H19DRAFT_1309446 [Mycena capillaripes]
MESAAGDSLRTVCKSKQEGGGGGRKGAESGVAIDLRGIRRDKSSEWNLSQVTPRGRSAAEGPAQRLGRVEVVAGGSLRGTSLRMVRCTESGAAIPPNGIHGWDVVANDPLRKVSRRDLVTRNHAWGVRCMELYVANPLKGLLWGGDSSWVVCGAEPSMANPLNEVRRGGFCADRFRRGRFARDAGRRGDEGRGGMQKVERGVPRVGRMRGVTSTGWE